MEALSSFIGIDVYLSGKVVGRISDFLIDTHNKTVSGIACVSTVGIIRSRFFVKRGGILHLDRNGVVVDKSYIRYKKAFDEEYSSGGFGVYRDKEYSKGSMGDMYFDHSTLKIESVSIKNGFLDDLIYGRDIVSVNDVSMTDKGIIVVNRE